MVATFIGTLKFACGAAGNRDRLTLLFAGFLILELGNV
jgi:hypothetical protein